jgi:hypothetical protein
MGKELVLRRFEVVVKTQRRSSDRHREKSEMAQRVDESRATGLVEDSSESQNPYIKAVSKVGGV